MRAQGVNHFNGVHYSLRRMKPAHKAQLEHLRGSRCVARSVLLVMLLARHTVLCRHAHGVRQHPYFIWRHADSEIVLTLALVLGKADADGASEQASEEEVPEQLLAHPRLADHPE